MTDIVTFLSARLDEDEAAAKDVPHDDWIDYDGWAELTNDVKAHAWRHDPARVLREVAAKRGLIEYAFKAAAVRDSEYGCTHSPDDIRAGHCPDEKPEELFILLTLANLWSEHPEFEPAWRVE